MRSLVRDQQTIYIANEVGFENYGEPVAYQGIISSKQGAVIEDNSIVLGEFNEMVTFEKPIVIGKGINKKSHFWLRKKPDDDLSGSDYTHEVDDIVVSPDDQYAMIILTGVDGYSPLD